MEGRVIGANKLLKKLGAMREDVQKEIAKAVSLAALDVQKTAVQSIQRGGRSGRVYEKTKAKKRHQASAPGEPPKTDTGALVQNITVENVNDLTATVGSREQAPHGKWLEFGTSRVAARPWLRPALQENKEKIDQRFIDAVRRGEEKARGR